MTIIDKIFKDKKGNTVIYILLAAGIFLLLAGNSLEPKQVNKVEELSLPQAEIEEKLEEILSQIKGAGKVSVMVSEENNGRKIFGYDVQGEDKKTVTLSQSGGETALVAEEKVPNVKGVIVVADGGGNIKVKEALLRAVRAVLGIEPHKIEVFERNESR